jgi:hypothetical protein
MDSAIRNLIRMIDYLPGMYGIGLVTMFINKQSRRLGDLAAGTVVVYVPKASVIRSVPLPPLIQPAPAQPRGTQNPAELEWNLRALSASDLTLIQGYLDRAPGFGEDARKRVGSQVAATIAGRIGADEPLDPQQFLQRVLELRRSEEDMPRPY